MSIAGISLACVIYNFGWFSPLQVLCIISLLMVVSILIYLHMESFDMRSTIC